MQQNKRKIVNKQMILHYINQLLKQARMNTLKEALVKANQEEAEDSSYQEELKNWNDTLPDGL